MVGQRTFNRTNPWGSITMTVQLISEQIVVDRVKRPKDRKPDEEIVRQLMQSIPAIGLLQPVILHRPSPGMGVSLVFGLNRLEAFARLKNRAIAAKVINGNTDEIKQWIIQAQRDENMIRRISVAPADPNVVSLVERKRALAS
jgi:ParB-like chromosome segregation protein Spo0J